MKYLAAWLLCLAAAYGQGSVTAVSASGGPEGATVRFGGAPPFGIPARTGAPYSAVEVTESVQTLGDGSTIRRKMPEVKMWRDSAGRMRTERPVLFGPMGQAQGDSPMMIEILDPVGRAKYVLDPYKKVAHKQELAEWKGGAVSARGASGTAVAPGGIVVSGGIVGATTAAGQPPRPEVKTEQLGSQLIEGVMAEGTRQTMTWPVGSQGNDRPLVVVNESWMSRELGMPVSTRTSDPRSGEHTRKLTQVSQSEPDAGLFQPPPGWTVIEEKGDFSIQYPRP